MVVGVVLVLCVLSCFCALFLPLFLIIWCFCRCCSIVLVMSVVRQIRQRCLSYFARVRVDWPVVGEVSGVFTGEPLCSL